MKNTKRIFSVITAILMVCSMMFLITGCNEKPNPDPSNEQTQFYDKQGNPIPIPSDNDEEGWFSVEVANQYAAPGLTQPENTTVVTKPVRNELYLKGDENAFKNTVIYAYTAISLNDGVYLPVFGLGDDGVATVTSLEKINYIDPDTLYPKGDTTSVNLIYKSGHKAYECTISYDKETDQVFIGFEDRTDSYLKLM